MSFVYVPRLFCQHCDKNTLGYHDYLAAHHHCRALPDATRIDSDLSNNNTARFHLVVSQRIERITYFLRNRSFILQRGRQCSHDASMMRRSRGSWRDDYIIVDSSLRDVKRNLQKIATFIQCMSERHKNIERHISLYYVPPIVSLAKRRRSTRQRFDSELRSSLQ